MQKIRRHGSRRDVTTGSTFGGDRALATKGRCLLRKRRTSPTSLRSISTGNDERTSTLTFSLPRTNILPGCVHLLLFAAYVMLLFDR